MIEIKDVYLPDGSIHDYFIDSKYNHVIDGTGLTLLPATIDPHVHFRLPGQTYKEDWETGAKAAIYGGVTTVFDMPNNLPPCVTFTTLQEKKKAIASQLRKAKIPLRHFLYLGADKHHFDQISLCKEHIIGIKLFMASSTNSFLINDDESLHYIFNLAAKHDLVIAIHAEDEATIQKNRALFSKPLDYKDHSTLRDEQSAKKAVQKVVDLVKKYHTKVYIVHLSTKDEMDIVRSAKAKKLPVYAEVTPSHLFLSTSDYESLGSKILINPPVRDCRHVQALWKAIDDDTIDCIGSDHSPHTLSDKAKPYGACPSGIPGVETTLPLLLNAYNEGKLSLEKIISLTHSRIQDVFNLPTIDDVVLVDLNLEKPVKNLKTKSGWSPFEGQVLKGWPIYTIVQGQVFNVV